jgi:hypothetical protein
MGNSTMVETQSTESDQSVVSMAASAVWDHLHIAAYTALQKPVNAVTQLVDHTVGTQLEKQSQFISAPADSNFGDARWHSKTIVEGIASLVPLTLSAVLARPLSALAFARPLMASGLSAGRAYELANAAQIGMTFGTNGFMFTPAEFRKDGGADHGFWEQRIHGGAAGFVTGVALHGLSRPLGMLTGATRADAGWLSKTSNMMISGFPAGVIGAQADAMLYGNGPADMQTSVRAGYRSMIGAVGLGLLAPQTVPLNRPRAEYPQVEEYVARGLMEEFDRPHNYVEEMTGRAELGSLSPLQRVDFIRRAQGDLASLGIKPAELTKLVSDITDQGATWSNPRIVEAMRMGELLHSLRGLREELGPLGDIVSSTAERALEARIPRRPSEEGMPLQELIQSRMQEVWDAVVPGREQQLLDAGNRYLNQLGLPSLKAVHIEPTPRGLKGAFSVTGDVVVSAEDAMLPFLHPDVVESFTHEVGAHARRAGMVIRAEADRMRIGKTATPQQVDAMVTDLLKGSPIDRLQKPEDMEAGLQRLTYGLRNQPDKGSPTYRAMANELGQARNELVQDVGQLTQRVLESRDGRSLSRADRRAASHTTLAPFDDWPIKLVQAQIMEWGMETLQAVRERSPEGIASRLIELADHNVAAQKYGINEVPRYMKRMAWDIQTRAMASGDPPLPTRREAQAFLRYMSRHGLSLAKDHNQVSRDYRNAYIAQVGEKEAHATGLMGRLIYEADLVNGGRVGVTSAGEEDVPPNSLALGL